MFSQIKRQTVLCSWVTIITLATFVWAFILVAPQEAVAASVPPGTVVQVTPISSVSPENATVGDPVQMKVVSDVVVNGQVVIAANAPARGEITHAQKKGMLGKPGKIGITIRTVEAVDGTNIFVTGNKVIEGDDQMVASIVLTLLCLLGALIKGGDATLAAGTPIQCTTN